MRKHQWYVYTEWKNPTSPGGPPPKTWVECRVCGAQTARPVALAAFDTRCRGKRSLRAWVRRALFRVTRGRWARGG